MVIRLILLGPARMKAVMEPGQSRSADFADDKGLIPGFREGIDIPYGVAQERLNIVNGPDFLVLRVIPARITVHGNDVGKLKHLMIAGLHHGKGYRTARIKTLHECRQLGVNRLGLRFRGGAFVQEPPQDYRRMIEACLNHGCEVVSLRLAENRIQQVRRRFSTPRQTFLPDQNPHFVTAVQKVLILRIVRTPDKVAAALLHQHQVIDMNRIGESVTEIRVVLMAVDSEQLQRLSVQQKAAPPDLNLAQAEPLRHGIAADCTTNTVQCGRIRRPHARKRHIPFENGASVRYTAKHILLRSIVKRKTQFGLLRHMSAEPHLQLDTSRVQIQSSHLYAFDPELRQSRQREFVINSAVCIKIAFQLKLRNFFLVAPIVYGNQQRMTSGARTEIEIQRGERHMRGTDLFPIAENPACQPHSADVKTQKRLFLQRKIRPVAPGSLFSGKLFKNIETARQRQTAGKVQRMEIQHVKGQFFAKRELPVSAEFYFFTQIKTGIM